MFNPNIFKTDPKTAAKIKSQASRQYLMNDLEFHTKLIESHPELIQMYDLVKDPDAVTVEEFVKYLSLTDLKLYRIHGVSLQTLLLTHGLNITGTSGVNMRLAFHDTEFKNRVITTDIDFETLMPLLDFNLKNDTYSWVKYSTYEELGRFSMMLKAGTWEDIMIDNRSRSDHELLTLSEKLSTLGQFKAETQAESARRELVELRELIHRLYDNKELSQFKQIFKHAVSLNPSLLSLFKESTHNISWEDASSDLLAGEIVYGIDAILQSSENHVTVEDNLDESWALGFDNGYKTAIEDIQRRMFGNLNEKQQELINDVLGLNQFITKTDDSILDESTPGVTITFNDEIL